MEGPRGALVWRSKQRRLTLRVRQCHAPFARYVDHAPVSIEFTVSRTLFRVQHQALCDSLCDADTPLLLPTAASCNTTPRDLQPLEGRWLNGGLNEEQKQAVVQILRGDSRPAPYVIFGPPGTGKTVTLVETLTQAVFNFPSASGRILCCTPSNDAANLVTKRLAQHLPSKDLIRVMAHSRSRGKTPEAIRPYCTFAAALRDLAVCGCAARLAGKSYFCRAAVTCGRGCRAAP